MRLITLLTCTLLLAPLVAAGEGRVVTAPYQATVIADCQTEGLNEPVDLTWVILFGEPAPFDASTPAPEHGTCFDVAPGETTAAIEATPGSAGAVRLWYGFRQGDEPGWVDRGTACADGPVVVPIPEGATLLTVVVFPDGTPCNLGIATEGTLTVTFT